MANSDVRLKHKVQLRKKVEEPQVSGNNGGIDPNPTPDKPKSKSWLWILLGVIIIGVIGYVFFSNSGDKAVKTTELEVEDVAGASVPADTTVVKDADIEEIASNQGDGTLNKPEIQSPNAVETPSTVDNTSNASTSAKATNVSNDIEAEAMKVIRGDYGIGQERKDKLGSKYQTIQSRVNELKREGIF